MAVIGVIGRYKCNMTPVFFKGAILLFLKIAYLAYITQNLSINPKLNGKRDQQCVVRIKFDLFLY